jgi:hypothetical protein
MFTIDNSLEFDNVSGTISGEVILGLDANETIDELSSPYNATVLDTLNDFHTPTLPYGHYVVWTILFDDEQNRVIGRCDVEIDYNEIDTFLSEFGKLPE